MLTMSVVAVAQTPELMSYQSVLRGSNDQLIKDSTVGLQISILQGNINGSSVYTETHKPTTNSSGVFTLEIGGGTPVTGVFSSINWGNGPYFVKTEIDPAGGTNYSISGANQLLSVPYALYAKTAGVADSVKNGGGRW